MTSQFNFYDIYGFALPGFLLLALLWLPFGLIENKWPDAELSSALVGVILAYVAGHVLQTVAQKAMPSNFLNGRFPSAALLDRDNNTFTEEFKARLAHQISETFDLDVSYASSDRVRSDAFFLCRSALIKSKTAVYAEQFEGLYALMRGLSTAFGIAVAYYLGWAYSGLLSWWSVQLSGLAVLAGLLIALVALVIGERFRSSAKYSRWVMILSLLLAGFATGYYLGLSRVGVSEHRGQLIAAAVFTFFAAERCYSGYKAFAQEFAKAVYRDFSNYEKPAVGPKTNASNDADAES